MLALGLLLPLAGAQAQVTPPENGVQARTFPPAALRGHVSFSGLRSAQLNGNDVRVAPGLRVFDARNHLVTPTTLRDQKLLVHYLIEPSTGMLQTVWILTRAEARQPRSAPGMVERNFRFSSEQQQR